MFVSVNLPIIGRSSVQGFDVLGSKSEDKRFEFHTEVWEVAFIASKLGHPGDLRDFVA